MTSLFFSVRDDFERKLTEEGDFDVEKVMLRYILGGISRTICLVV